MIDGKEYAKQMRENAVIANNGNVIVSEELWQQIANIIEKQQAEIDELRKRIVFWRQDLNYNPKAERAEAIKEFAEKLKRKAYRFPCAIGTEYAVPIRAINETAGGEE